MRQEGLKQLKSLDGTESLPEIKDQHLRAIAQGAFLEEVRYALTKYVNPIAERWHAKQGMTVWLSDFKFVPVLDFEFLIIPYLDEPSEFPKDNEPST